MDFTFEDMLMDDLEAQEGYCGDGDFGMPVPMDYGYQQDMMMQNQMDNMMMQNQIIMNNQMMMQDQMIRQEEFNMKYRGPKENYQFMLDSDLLQKIGFNVVEIGLLSDAVSVHGVLTAQKLAQPPLFLNDNILINRIMYAYNICMGRTVVDIESPQSLSKHLKKLARIQGSYSAFSCAEIPNRKIGNVMPRTAIVAGIPEGSFSVLNSEPYGLMDGTYEVVSIAKEWVTIKSNRLMQVTYKDRLNQSYENRQWGIDGILQVVEVGNIKENKPWIIKIHKKHCRLRNKFLVYVSTHKIVPGVTKHLGGYEVVIGDGTILYVYAKLNDLDAYANPKDKIPEPNNHTIVHSYGSYNNEIRAKLDKAMDSIASLSTIVYCRDLDDPMEFKIVPSNDDIETHLNRNKYIEDEEEPEFIMEMDEDLGGNNE